MLRILVVQGSSQLTNCGDIAMLQVGLDRLSQWQPDSAIRVLANQAERLARFCPQAMWASSPGLALWSSALIARVARRLPPPMTAAYDAFERIARYRVPALGGLILNRKARLKQGGGAHLQSIRTAMAQADLVVAVGGGYLNDEFPHSGSIVLRCLEWAGELKKPTFMFGQGIGPLTDARLLATARAVLPRVSLIALREKQTSLPILRSLNVPADRIMVTGDDAIEPAWAARPEAPGRAIGVNLRMARYSGVTPAHGEAIGAVVHAVAGRLGAAILPIPIADDDHAAIARSLGVTEPPAERGPIDTPQAAMAQVGRCRVVLTGSYHAGVFALAQGIPVVSVARSPYYFAKFHGLADQFGGGCAVLDADDAQLPHKLADALIAGWNAADDERRRWLDAARRQIRDGQRAYQAAHHIVESRGDGLPGRTYHPQ